MVRSSVSYIREQTTGTSVNQQAAHWIIDSSDMSAVAGGAMDDWLAEDDAHIEAYAEGLLIWEQLGQVAGDGASERLIHPNKWRLPAAIAAMAAVILLAFGFGSAFMTPTYKTGIGEQRTVRLEDGTRLVLNTNSVLKVDFEKGIRRVRLERGEALFNVAHDKQRPFVVEANDKYVEAVGTLFVVRSEAQGMEVTLLSGLVDIGRGHFNPSAKKISLTPGDRWRETGAAPVLDRPQIETVTAWRNGEIIFDETPLNVAIAEVNRYTKKSIVLNDQGAAERKISGVVRIAEPEIFVETVAGVYDLRVNNTDKAVTLSSKVAP
ncbi:FecR domain-containing protein [Asticcacaulis sp. SL142]|uniref:FecR family protein n=1 Tax=Asticcacaulis sp. SL142 TaxID=2995155 RepID=UPI00226C73D4|nr:FecR domain-containing protein [Asticcacaulis sp. SL142]WAC48353.1 FecR domain-containing protein [Asticcacaulis sp. SL142]